MASKKSNGNPVCPMCFESPQVVKIVGTCKHAFCTDCLSSHLESLSPGSEVFPCPTCRVECPLPSNGVDGLVDHSDVDDMDYYVKVKGKSRKAASSKRDGQQLRQKYAEEICDAHNSFIECQSCRYEKGTVVPAVYLCEECGHFNLCTDCTRVHGKNKVTKDHVVIPIKPVERKTFDICERHKVPMKNYCCTCSTPVCHICIMFDHGDHDVKKIDKIFRSVIEKVKSTVKDQEERSKDLKSIEKSLKVLKCAALDTEDTLVKAIEDHAEKCIDQIIKQKEVLKSKVRNDFAVVYDVTACLETMPALVDRVDASVTKANGLLESDIHPVDLVALYSIKDEMEANGKLTDDIDKDHYWQSFEKMWEKNVHFVPSTEDFKVGTLEMKKVIHRVGELIQVDAQELQVEDKAKFIPCVANLGKTFYAVAHPTNADKPSDAINIYKYHGTLRQTLKEHVYPVYDMAATPEGKLAVLSDGTYPGTSCCVRIFDPVTGYVRSTADFSLRGHLSFDVNTRNQYVILSNDGGRRITVFREDGSVVLTHLVNTNLNKTKDPFRITCGGMSIFVMSEHCHAVYAKQKEGIILSTTEPFIYECMFKDVSATCSGILGACYIKNMQACLGRNKLMKNKLSEWYFMRGIGKPAHGANSELRLSASDDYIVMTQGQTVRIYTELDKLYQ